MNLGKNKKNTTTASKQTLHVNRKLCGDRVRLETAIYPIHRYPKIRTLDEKEEKENSQNCRKIRSWSKWQEKMLLVLRQRVLWLTTSHTTAATLLSSDFITCSSISLHPTSFWNTMISWTFSPTIVYSLKLLVHKQERLDSQFSLTWFSFAFQEKRSFLEFKGLASQNIYYSILAYYSQ